MEQPQIEITNEHFFGAFRNSNPFTKNRVSELGDAEVDVPAIHEDSFKQLIRRVERLGQDQVSAGVLLLGAAGVGKSHLLARLCHWARDEDRCSVVFLHNVVASPPRMSRYLLRATVSALAGSRPAAYCESELYRLINRAVKAQLRREGLGGVPSTSVRVQTLQRVARIAPEDATIVQAMAAFLRAAIEASNGDARAERCATAAVEWLAGEVVEAETAALLGLPAADEEGASLVDDIGVEGVFRILARLAAAADRVFILCIDQVDNLDGDQVTALASFLHVLLDHTKNLLIITSGVKQSMLQFQRDGVIPAAAWDRLAQYVIELNRVDDGKARGLVEARVSRFMQPFRDLPSLGALRGRDQLFPLDERWLSSRLAEIPEFRPRDVITWAHARWEELQDLLDAHGGPGWLRNWPGKADWRGPQPPETSREQEIDRLADKKLAERVQQRQLQPESLPPDADNLSTLAFALLGHCKGDARYSLVELERCAQKGRAPIYDFIARERRSDGSLVSSGVLFVTSNNKVKVAAALRRLLEDGKPPDHRILVTDRERRPLALGPKGKEYHDKLVALGGAAFTHVQLGFDEYAQLDAFAGFIGSARVGDLDVEHPPGDLRPVSEAEAVESLHRQNKLVGHRLLQELLTEESAALPEPPPPPPIGDDRIRDTIPAHLAWRLGLTSKELTALVIDAEHIDRALADRVHNQIRDTARRMHAEGVLHATAQDDGMFLQLLVAR